MAKPINETPVLKGKDAEVFLSKLLKTVNGELSKEEAEQKALELENLKAKYDQLKPIFKCAF